MDKHIWDVNIVASEEQLKEIGIYQNTRNILLSDKTFLGYFDKNYGEEGRRFIFKDERLPDILWVNEDHVSISVVRDNLMYEEGYTGYCGQIPETDDEGNVVGKVCSWPRTVFDWDLKQFKCRQCGWVSKYNGDFIQRYIAKWNFTSETVFRPKIGF